MASQLLPKLRVYLPLWQRRVPRYPLYVEGNPQLRVFLPLFWMKMLKPKRETPPDVVLFEVHPQMTKLDIKNYLDKIYGVKTLQVHSSMKKGKEIKSFGSDVGHEPHRRFAFVQLDKEFKLPDMFKEKPTREKKTIDDFSKMEKEAQKETRKTWHRSDLPVWFR